MGGGREGEEEVVLLLMAIGASFLIPICSLKLPIENDINIYDELGKRTKAQGT